MQENPRELGGGVAVLNVAPGSNAAGFDLQPGLQLLAAGGLPVHGMSLENAVRPIEAAEKKVQLTFFKGGAVPHAGYRARFACDLHPKSVFGMIFGLETGCFSSCTAWICLDYSGFANQKWGNQAKWHRHMLPGGVLWPTGPESQLAVSFPP